MEETVDWTNPWGEYKYIDDIELREDGGTPGFLQAIRTALCIELKNQMGTPNIHLREKELVKKAFELFRPIPHLHILADEFEDRLGVFSFYIDHVHYNLVVKLLNDLAGIQVRGGCTCAGTYGHYLLNVSYEQSKRITEKINQAIFRKTRWVTSIHFILRYRQRTRNHSSQLMNSYSFSEISRSVLYNPRKRIRHRPEPVYKTILVKIGSALKYF